MVRAENKYKAWLLDEENVWGKPTEEQEKIAVMSIEINSLKKEHRGTPSKTSKPKQTGKKQAAKKLAPKKPADKKKKANDKWVWRSKPPKETDTKENCKVSSGSNRSSANANIAAFDTVDSDSDQE